MKDRWITAREAADITGFSVGTLKTWRSQRRGPSFYRIGKSVRYKEAEVRLWFERKGSYHVNK